MKKTILCLALLSLVALSGPAFATIVANDDVPAATLLLPYFEVEYNKPDGLTTLFSIANASAAPALAHVTMWTDESVPTLDFDVYLTGYDVQTINIRDIFNGILPQTADDQNDPKDAISPEGPISLDLSYLGCLGALPVGNLTPLLIAHIKAAHTGNSSPVFNRCAGFDFGDDPGDMNAVARGYITVDNVNTCSLLFPSSPGYFAVNGTGIANNINQLWGDYFYVDEINNFAQGETLVHIEACGDTVATAPGPSIGDQPNCPFVAGDYTFYGRYVGALATDGREPLPTTWAARYLLGGLVDGTDYIVWRDPKVASNLTGFTCGTNAAWYPMNQNQVVAFDEFEDATEICITRGPRISPPTGQVETCFPLEAGRYPVGVDPLTPPYDFGWMYLNLNTNTSGIGGFFGDTAQSWVTNVISAAGRFSVGYDAIPLDNAYFTNPGTTPIFIIP